MVNPQQALNTGPLSLTPSASKIFSLVTSNDNKVAEINDYLASNQCDALVRKVDLPSADEFQPTDIMTDLRFQGRYLEVAKESALQKMNSLLTKEGVVVKPGLTIEDTSFFVHAMKGYPGVLAAEFFNGPKDAQGKKTNNEVALHTVCNNARDFANYRATFIVTFVTLDGKLNPLVAQGMTEGFIPSQPRGDGWAFDMVFCPDPRQVAKRFGTTEEHMKLDVIAKRDINVALPREADKMGLLVTFAEKPELKKLWSPRNIALEKLSQLQIG